MTNHQTTALVSRQAGGITPSVPAQAMSSGRGLPEAIELANALSKAGPLIPRDYRDKPGAVLAVLMWGEANGVDPFTAMQNIHLIDERNDGNPKPMVSAEMRVELATRKGFEFKVTEATRERCTIQVWRGGEMRGEWTSRIEDIPEDRFSVDRQTGEPKKKTRRDGTTYTAKPGAWDTRPHYMLLRDAERTADAMYVKTAAALVDHSGWDEPDRGDVLDVLTSDPEGEPEPPPAEDAPAPEPESEAPARAQPGAEVDDLTAPPPEPVTVAQLRKAGKVADLLKTASAIKGQAVTIVDDIVADQALARTVLQRMGK